MITSDPRNQKDEELSATLRFLHLGLMVFGTLAWLTSYWAGDYKTPHPWGFTVHKWLGLGVSLFLALRLLEGVWGPEANRFSQWRPYTRERLKLAGEDLMGLLQLKLPERPRYQGLSGLVYALGLLTFTWMAFTGILMFTFLPTGRRASGLMWLIKELHELGGRFIKSSWPCTWEQWFCMPLREITFGAR